MANQINTQLFAATIAATIKREVPILEYVNKTLSNRLISGAGATVDVLVPNYRPVLRRSSFFNPANTNAQTLDSLNNLRVQVDSVPVNILPRVTGASTDVLERTLKLFTEKSQVEDPSFSKFATSINRDVFQSVFGGCGSAVVGNIDSSALAKAAAAVTRGRIDGKKFGMLSPFLETSIATSPQFRWFDSALSRKNYEGLLGRFVDTEFFMSPDAGEIKLGSTPAQAYAFSGTVAQIVDGATQLVLSGITFGGDTLATIPGGTPIVIGSGDPTVEGSWQSAFTVADAYSTPTRVARVFVVKPNIQEDANGNIYDAGWAISSGSATVPVEKINLQSVIAGVIQPSAAAVADTTYTSGSAQPATSSFICPLLAGATYAVGAVGVGNVVAFASASPKPLESINSGTSTLDGEYNVRVSWGGNITEGRNVMRIEGLDGVSALYRAGGVALYGLV